MRGKFLERKASDIWRTYLPRRYQRAACQDEGGFEYNSVSKRRMYSNLLIKAERLYAENSTCGNITRLSSLNRISLRSLERDCESTSPLGRLSSGPADLNPICCATVIMSESPLVSGQLASSNLSHSWKVFRGITSYGQQDGLESTVSGYCWIFTLFQVSRDLLHSLSASKASHTDLAITQAVKIDGITPCLPEPSTGFTESWELPTRSEAWR